MKEKESLPMSEADILLSYRQAKNKKNQIQILAELNLCTKDEIIEILRRQGVDSRELPRNRKKKQEKPTQVPPPQISKRHPQPNRSRFPTRTYIPNPPCCRIGSYARRLCVLKLN